jgi:hypothetical protein
LREFQSRIGIPASYGRIAWSNATSIEALCQFSFEPAAPNQCGSFRSLLDFMAEHCRKAMFRNLSGRRSARLRAGRPCAEAHVRRAGDRSRPPLRAGLRYPDVGHDVELSPTLFFGHDVSGWTGDGLILEGRLLANLTLQANFATHWTGAISWQPTRGGRYNPIRRSIAGASAAVSGPKQLPSRAAGYRPASAAT